ncbi:hypothetical protein HYS50_03730 [Candidatus Woesearchaeota archaeon]|nr:hypothetical protein [Candidatus Woesearchaeota archaeon]
MAGFDLVGIALVVVAIVYAFFKKKDRVALALIIVLLVLLYILGYLN